MTKKQRDIRPLAQALGRLLLNNYNAITCMYSWWDSLPQLLWALEQDDKWREWGDRPQTLSQLTAMLNRNDELQERGIVIKYRSYVSFVEELQEALS